MLSIRWTIICSTINANNLTKTIATILVDGVPFICLKSEMIKLMNSSSVNDLIWSSLFNIYFQYLQVAHFFKFGMITSLIMPKLFLIFLILLIGLCLKWFKIQHWYWYICSMSKEFVFFGYQYRTRFCSLVTVRYHRPFSGFTVQSENIAKCKRSIEDMPVT